MLLLMITNRNPFQYSFVLLLTVTYHAEVNVKTALLHDQKIMQHVQKYENDGVR